MDNADFHLTFTLNNAHHTFVSIQRLLNVSMHAKMSTIHNFANKLMWICLTARWELLSFPGVWNTIHSPGPDTPYTKPYWLSFSTSCTRGNAVKSIMTRTCSKSSNSRLSTQSRDCVNIHVTLRSQVKSDNMLQEQRLQVQELKTQRFGLTEQFHFIATTS